MANEKHLDETLERIRKNAPGLAGYVGLGEEAMGASTGFSWQGAPVFHAAGAQDSLRGVGQDMYPRINGHDNSIGRDWKSFAHLESPGPRMSPSFFPDARTESPILRQLFGDITNTVKMLLASDKIDLRCIQAHEGPPLDLKYRAYAWGADLHDSEGTPQWDVLAKQLNGVFLYFTALLAGQACAVTGKDLFILGSVHGKIEFHGPDREVGRGEVSVDPKPPKPPPFATASLWAYVRQP